MCEVVWIAAVLLSLATGQVQIEGSYAPEPFTTAQNALRQIPEASFHLPQLDNHLLRLRAEHERPGPFKFGEAMPVKISMANGNGAWSLNEQSETRKWRVVIHSKDAVSLSLLFDDFYLPPDSELYVLGKESVLGAYTGDINNKEDGSFAIQPVPGDTLVLEYIEAAKKGEKTKARISVNKVVHGFRASMMTETAKVNESGPCNVDVKCPIGQKFRKQIDAVAVMITDQGQRFCSGVMINNTAMDGAQFFLTASHCVFTDQSNFILGFNYQYSGCRSQGQGGNLQLPQTVQGLSLVAQYDASDFALFLVKERIPDNYNVFLAGWDNRRLPPRNVATIHHPSGDAKKISIYNGVTKPASWLEGNSQYHWEVPFWLYGVTEPGSSGSPLFNDKGLVVGHLHGGQSSCNFKTGYDMYGALWADWAAVPNKSINTVSGFLNPTGRAVLAMPGIYLKSIANRRIPSVIPIKPLYKVNRPRFLGPAPARAVDHAPAKDSKADAINDLSDGDAELEKELIAEQKIVEQVVQAQEKPRTGPLCMPACSMGVLLEK